MESSRAAPRKLGLIVNPIAGMGGAVALKGTDGAVDQAVRLGAQPQASLRAARALRALGEPVELLTAGARMGEDVARAAGFEPTIVSASAAAETTAADTQDAARAMADAGVDLLLFAGGDGTARDIFDVVHERIPMLGIPAGVKMHSAVFATSAAHAGELARRYLDDEGAVSIESAEVMDRDAAIGERVSPRLYGFARTLRVPLLTQYAKSTTRLDDDGELRAACRRAAELAEADALTILGPGTTMRRVKQSLGFEGTLDGVDLVSRGRPIVLDATELQLLGALREASRRHGGFGEAWHAQRAGGGISGAYRLSGEPRSRQALEPARIIVSVVGGQGFLFGRGNPQISAEVIRRVGREHIVVIASRSKLLALPEQRLFVDTGAPDVDALLSGYMQVWTGTRERMVYRVEGGSACAPAS